MRLTVAQALVRFLSAQYSERDGVEQRLIAGCFGIFGHGNVAGVGQALLEQRDDMPYVLARNEQAMVHAAAGYARQKNRLSTYACTASVGPGSTNMVTGAALATINRLPVLLLPGDIFATRVASPVLQELEDPTSLDVSVNDCFKPVSRFWDRINRPEQLLSSALAAMRVLTDPAETGTVTLSLPQDVQAEAFDWPEEFFARRVWHVRRSPAEPERLAEAAALLRGARRPLIVCGGGTIYAEATDALRALAEATGVPVAETQAGKGSLPYDHPQSLGAIGATGTTAANAIAREADVVLGVGTRWSDFTTASRSVFADPGVRFVNLNVAPVDAAKHAGVPLLADARVGLEGLRDALDGLERRRRAHGARALASPPSGTRRSRPRTRSATSRCRRRARCSASSTASAARATSSSARRARCRATSTSSGARATRRATTSSTASRCMGYEIAGGLGVKLAAPDREVYVMVGDGSFLMMAQEIVTAVQEQIKLTIVLVQNHGFASIGALSESLGSQRFGTSYRGRDGEVLPVDLAAVAAGLGADVHRTTTIGEFEAALREAAAASRITVVEVQTDPLVGAPDSEAWWDVPVAEVAGLESTRAARETYEQNKRTQRQYVT